MKLEGSQKKGVLNRREQRRQRKENERRKRAGRMPALHGRKV